MRAVVLAGLIIIGCGVSSAFLTPAADSQTTDAATRCDAIQDKQSRAACFAQAGVPVIDCARPRDANEAAFCRENLNGGPPPAKAQSSAQSPVVLSNESYKEAPTTECDTYAAAPFDPQRKADGVSFQKINPALVIPACESAVRQYPNSKRLTFQLGRAFDKNADYSSALIQYRQAAEQGYAPAQNAIGVAYNLGDGVLKDEAQAAIWFRKAAEQGNAPAQSNLAVAYEFGRGVAQDILQAAAWHRKAAEQGFADSQVTLGFYYEKGLGVEKDDAKAVVWFRKAAEQGDANGQYDFGVMYQYGRGVAKDTAQATDWYRKAAEQGNEAAKKKMAEMKETKQTPSPAATAQGDVQWDPNKMIQNARTNAALVETRICARDATKAALLNGVRNLDQIRDFVLKMCKPAWVLLGTALKGPNKLSDQQTKFILSVMDEETNRVLRLGR